MLILRILISGAFVGLALTLLLCWKASGEGWMALMSVPLASAGMAMLVHMLQEITNE